MMRDPGMCGVGGEQHVGNRHCGQRMPCHSKQL